jgi:hypothetical protein
MKHEISRLRPVFDGAKYVALLHHFRGWDALDADGVRIGSYPEHMADAAVARLRRLAASECSS